MIYKIVKGVTGYIVYKTGYQPELRKTLTAAQRAWCERREPRQNGIYTEWRDLKHGTV